ncbi:hypothetical protein V7S43_006064 [Phytophthora oleae]|uniref:Uncharacterized protein n=1 Tax=Phytophthora oleae TaxID=2107226 RepID=A0ABD3FST1_9STRA
MLRNSVPTETATRNNTSISSDITVVNAYSKASAAHSNTNRNGTSDNTIISSDTAVVNAYLEPVVASATHNNANNNGTSNYHAVNAFLERTVTTTPPYPCSERLLGVGCVPRPHRTTPTGAGRGLNRTGNANNRNCKSWATPPPSACGEASHVR